jgi:hypothetical protein
MLQPAKLEPQAANYHHHCCSTFFTCRIYQSRVVASGSGVVSINLLSIRIPARSTPCLVNALATPFQMCFRFHVWTYIQTFLPENTAADS